MGWHPLPYVVAVIGDRTRSETCQCTSSAGATALCGTNVIAMPQREIFIIKMKNKRARTLQEGQGNYFSCIQVFSPPMVLLGKPFAGMHGGLRQSLLGN